MRETAHVAGTVSSPVRWQFLVLGGLLAAGALPARAAQGQAPGGVVREILYKNAHHVKPDDLDKLTGIQRGVPLNPSQNVRACRALQDAYRKKGRLLCSVTLDEGSNPGDERVVFNITEGPVFRVRQTRFLGNDTLATGQRLETQTDTGRSVSSSIYNPEIVEHDVLKLEEYYKGNGYLDARVTHEIVCHDDLRAVDIVFHIHEGLRYRVADVTVEGTKALDRGLVRSIVRVRQGDVYSASAVEADLRNITDLYGYRGYEVVVEKRLFRSEKDPGAVRVQYEVVERGPSRVGEVIIEGNTVTKDRVIRRVLQFYPGQILSYPAIRQAEKDLARMGIFEMDPKKGGPPRVIVEEPEDPSDNFKNVRVVVQEQPTGTLAFGLGINSNAGLAGSSLRSEKTLTLPVPVVRDFGFPIVRGRDDRWQLFNFYVGLFK